MAKKLFILYGNPELSRVLHTEVGEALSKKSETRDNAEKSLKTKSKSLGRLKFLKLHLLHREFAGPHTPFGRIMVASNRYARQRFKRFKIRSSEAG